MSFLLVIKISVYLCISAGETKSEEGVNSGIAYNKLYQTGEKPYQTVYDNTNTEEQMPYIPPYLSSLKNTENAAIADQGVLQGVPNYGQYLGTAYQDVPDS